MNGQRNLTAKIPGDAAGRRLDKVLASLFPPYSRSQLQNWLREGRMTMEGSIPSQRQIVRGGEQLHLLVPKEAPQEWQPQSLPLKVVYEDSEIVVIDKPAGLVVHPGAGNPDTTLANAILHHYPENRMLARAGVVHRLDKGTTGVILFAKNGTAQTHLRNQFMAREVKKSYGALVEGLPDPPRGESIFHVEENPSRPGSMRFQSSGKECRSHYQLLEAFKDHSWVEIQPHTGRTHQVRLTMLKLGAPVCCDTLYGSGNPLLLSSFKRNYRLGRDGLEHPLLSRLGLHAQSIQFPP